MALRLVTLGELALRLDDGSLVAESMRKPLLVLAVLAGNRPAATTRDQLVGLLWPASPVERGRQALNQSLYALRKHLGIDPITSGPLLNLEGAISTDLDALRQAIRDGDVETVTRLASLPFLPGIAVADSPEFDHWVDRIRRELDASVCQMLRTRATELMPQKPTEAASLWRQYAERNLLDPPAVRGAAEQIARTGNYAAAIQLLQRHVEALARELEVGPDAETAAMLRTLRDVPVVPDGLDDARTDRVSLPVPVDRSRDATAAIASVSSASVSVPHPIGTAPSGQRARTLPRLAVGAVTVLLVGLVALFRPTPDDRTRTVLVAPYLTSGDTSIAYLGPGLADDIASRLNGLPGVTLISPSLASANTPDSLLARARQLNADYLLEGTVRTEPRGTQPVVRITCRLIAVENGRLVWSWTVDRKVAELPRLQGAIADSVAHRITFALSASAQRQLETLPTEDPTAYDLYLRAMQYLRAGRDGLPEARLLLRQAVARDSGFSAALARLGETQARMNWYGFDRDSTRMAEALTLIERSLRRSPRQPEPHVAMAQWLLTDRRAYPEAAAHLDSALRVSGATVDLLMTRANLRRRMGRWTESAADYAEAARLDPTAYGVQLEFGNTLLLMRRYAEARMALEQARLVAPDAVDPIVWLAALAVRERVDTVSARRLIHQALPHVNAHALVARIVQSFPELVRAIPDSLRLQMREFSLRDAYGDSALLYVIRAELEPTVPRRRAHLDSAATILAGRIAKDPDALGAHRVLSAVRLAQGNAPGALRLARRALEIMPPSRDALAAMQGLVILAEAEIRSGARDSARVHLRQLLEQPSVLTPALVATDPVWRLAGLPNR